MITIKAGTPLFLHKSNLFSVYEYYFGYWSFSSAYMVGNEIIYVIRRMGGKKIPLNWSFWKGKSGLMESSNNY
jgi:hypothetical protein